MPRASTLPWPSSHALLGCATSEHPNPSSVSLIQCFHLQVNPWQLMIDSTPSLPKIRGQGSKGGVPAWRPLGVPSLVQMIFLSGNSRGLRSSVPAGTGTKTRHTHDTIAVSLGLLRALTAVSNALQFSVCKPHSPFVKSSLQC